MKESADLSGQAALVIGASSPLGRAIAVALAEAGANVGVATTLKTSEEEVIANSCCNEMWALDRRTFAQAIDARNEADVRSLIDRALGDLGRLDILVNAHHLPLAKPFGDLTFPDWLEMIDVRLNGVFLACRAAGESMRARGRGWITNIVASPPGQTADATASPTSPIDAAVLDLTRALAAEWAARGVAVNALCVGHSAEKRLSLKQIARTAVLLSSHNAGGLTGQAVWADRLAVGQE